MKKHVLLKVGLVAVLATVVLVGCAPGNVAVEGLNFGVQQEGIWVSGEGKVTAAPDIATLRLGIEAQQASVAEAQTEAAQAMDKVMKSLTDNGIDDKDIQTQYFNISPVTRWDNEKQEEIVLGYRVSNMVIAKIRDIDKVSVVIDAVAVAGGDFTRIQSIGFSIDDPTVYQEQAREKAVADAKTKAEKLAHLAGVKLGKPTYITEGVSAPPVIYPRGMYEGAVPAPAPAVETPISPGELEVTLNVQVVYAILN
ncbi:SIMPL domain-containing protein [Chloroflexota bacterium]